MVSFNTKLPRRKMHLQGVPPVSHLKHVHKKISRRFIVMLLICVGIFLLLRMTRVSYIACNVDGQACPPVFQINSDDIRGKSILFLKTKQISEHILNANPVIARVGVVRQLPASIIIHLYYRIPKYVLVSPQQTFLLDAEGMVLPQSIQPEVSDLYTIESAEPFAVGQKVASPSVLSAMKLGDLMNNSGIRVREIKIISSSDITVTLVDGLLLRVNADKDLAKQIDSIMLVQSQPIGKDKNPIREIDVRFNDPIIR